MLGSWLPKCNNLYDNIYQRIVIEFSVCAQALQMKKKSSKHLSHMSVSTLIGHVYTKKGAGDAFAVHVKCKIHTDMQNGPSAGPKGFKAVAVCTVLNLCSYMYMV